jgi:hypothetical protein
VSIWCSWEHIGTDPRRWTDEKGRPNPKVAERGHVLSYAVGWSNHYPDHTGEAERPAVLALAHIAPWCVPGNREEEVDHDAVGPWLRLEVAAPETLDFWTKGDDGRPSVVEEGATVVLSEEAVRSLRDDLTRWLDAPKARPTTAPRDCAEHRETTEIEESR